MADMFNSIFYKLPVKMLLFIRNSSKPPKQADLSRRLRTHPGNVLRVMRRLCKADLARLLPRDKKTGGKAYILTEKGIKMADELWKIKKLINDA